MKLRVVYTKLKAKSTCWKWFKFDFNDLARNQIKSLHTNIATQIKVSIINSGVIYTLNFDLYPYN